MVSDCGGLGVGDLQGSFLAALPFVITVVALFSVIVTPLLIWRRKKRAVRVLSIRT
jgi:uncharacterized Tic20 family protein